MGRHVGLSAVTKLSSKSERQSKANGPQFFNNYGSLTQAAISDGHDYWYCLLKMLYA
jgi:hypothetical protein